MRPAVRGIGPGTFLNGERTQQDIMFRETMDQLDAGHEALPLAYSRTDENRPGRTGHIQSPLGDLLDDPTGTGFYICGVPQMVVDTKEVLADYDVPAEYMHTEGWEDDAVGE